MADKARAEAQGDNPSCQLSANGRLGEHKDVVRSRCQGKEDGGGEENYQYAERYQQKAIVTFYLCTEICNYSFAVN